jgi:predicted nucleic acid-binding protein
MMPIVIDANIAIYWFSSRTTKIAEMALEAVGREGAVVPALWRWEVQDVLRRLARDGHLHVTASDAMSEMRRLPISVDDGLKSLFGSESALARDYGLSVYDAAYLEVALRLNVQLATVDKKLATAARAAGVAFTV